MSIESLCTGAFLVGADLGQRSIGDEPGPSTPCLIFCPRPAHKPAPLSLPSLPQSKRYFACTRTESPGANGGSDHCRETRTDQSPQKRAGAAEPEQYLFRQLNSTIRVAAILDQEVDPLVLQRVAYPENLASHLFALIRDRPEFATQTSELRMIDSSGHVVDANVTWVRTIVPGPMPQCGYFVQSGPRAETMVRMPLDGPLLPADWTAEISYLANSEGAMHLSLNEGPETKVTVAPGAEPRLRPVARCGRHHHRATDHRRPVGVPGGRAGGVPRTALAGARLSGRKVHDTCSATVGSKPYRSAAVSPSNLQPKAGAARPANASSLYRFREWASRPTTAV